MLLEHIRRDVAPSRQFPTETLYHKDVGFPDNAKMPARFSPLVKLRYGPHATDAALTDKYRHEVHLPKVINLEDKRVNIFEIGMVGRIVTKVCARIPYDDQYDLTLVISTQNGHVRSVWLNSKNDKHKTLDTSRYTKPNKAIKV